MESPAKPTTRFQTALKASRDGGLPALGQWLCYPGAVLARTVASLGYSWVLVDCEHGNLADADMYDAVRAIAAGGTSPIVRLPWGEPWMIKRALDTGAHGIMVPMVETKEQAETIVSACRYRSQAYPSGSRGCGTPFAPTAFGLGPVDYHNHSNDLVTLIVQIETERGLQNVDAIASVPGVDAIFIGPNDLACSLGFFPFSHAQTPEVQDAVEKVRQAAVKAGKAAGYFCMNAEEAVARSKMGWDFMNVGADVAAVAGWMSTQLKAVKDELVNPGE